MGAPHRCHRCKTRHSLPKRIDLYVRPKRCPGCKGPLYFDKYRAFKEHKRIGKDGRKVTCGCPGYEFPHRRGSLWCQHYQHERTDHHFEQRFPSYGRPDTMTNISG